MEQRHSRHILHDDIQHAGDFPEVVNADEIGMVEAGHGLGLGLESLAECGVRAEFLGQDLDGDGPIQGFLDRLIDRAHAAGGDQRARFRIRGKAGRVPRGPER